MVNCQSTRLHCKGYQQSGKSGTIRESNLVSGVRKGSIVLARTGIRKFSSVACGFSPIKVHFSDYRKSLLSRINEVYVFFYIKYRYAIAIFY